MLVVTNIYYFLAPSPQNPTSQSRNRRGKNKMRDQKQGHKNARGRWRVGGGGGHTTGQTGHMPMRDGEALFSFPTKPMRPAHRSFSGRASDPGSVPSLIAPESSHWRELPRPWSQMTTETTLGPWKSESPRPRGDLEPQRRASPVSWTGSCPKRGLGRERESEREKERGEGKRERERSRLVRKRRRGRRGGEEKNRKA